MRHSVWLGLVALLGCGQSAPRPLGMAHGLAILNSDYRSTALTLLDPLTGRLVDNCLTSGAVTARLSQPVSGDAVLPTQAPPEGELVLVDRAHGAVLWLDPSHCAPLRQLAVAQGFAANPHDFLQISPGKAYVTRHAPNPHPDAPALARGNDILIVDPSAPSVIGSIDVSGHATAAADGSATLARPDHLVMAGGRVFVSLGSTSRDFLHMGPGRLLVLDPITDEVLGRLDLPEYVGCSALATNAAQTQLAVACAGNFNVADPTAGSGVVVYDLTATPPRQVWAVRANAADGALSGATISLGPQGLVFVTSGQVDALWRAPLDAAPERLQAATSSYVYGSVWVNPGSGDVYLTDASATPAVAIVASGGQVRRVQSAPASALPPRLLAAF